MRTMIGRVLTVAATSATLVLGGAVAAHADGNVCESGEFCLYENKNFNTGTHSTYGKHQWGGSDSSYENNLWWDYVVPGHHNTDHLQDEASSLWNHTSCTVAISEGYNGDGDTSNYSAGVQDTTFDNNNVSDNTARSHQFLC